MGDKEFLHSRGWTLGEELGSGHFAKVKLVTRLSDGKKAACKIIKKPGGVHAASSTRAPFLMCHSNPPELKKRALVAKEHEILVMARHKVRRHLMR